jgi:hypothetical protein
MVAIAFNQPSCLALQIFFVFVTATYRPCDCSYGRLLCYSLWFATVLFVVADVLHLVAVFSVVAAIFPVVAAGFLFVAATFLVIAALSLWLQRYSL